MKEGLKLDLGNYVVTSDGFNLILNEKKITKTTKGVGHEVGRVYLRPFKYYSNWASLVDGIIQHQLKVSEETMQSMMDVARCIVNVQTNILTALAEHK